MRRPSLRWMMLVPILASITVGFVAFALYIDHGERATRTADIDAELSRADAANVAPSTPPGAAAPGEAPIGPSASGTDAETAIEVDPPVHLTVSADGQVVAQRGAANPFSVATLQTLAAVGRPRTIEVQDHRARVTPLPDGQIRITALSLDSYHDAVDNLRRTLVLGGVVILVVEAAVVSLLATRLVRPLATIAETTNQIAGGTLDTKMDIASGSREVTDLSTDIGRMVDRLRAALDEQERSAAVATNARDDMQRLLADVSHEIRTPLTALKGYSELYHGGMLTEPGALDQAMERVGSESDRLHGLVNAMLELTRGIERQKLSVDVDTAKVLGAVVGDLRAAYPQRRLDLDTDDFAPHLPGDPARIHQAVLNLGANACAHTEPHTPISISMRSTDNMITVSVVDHGPGIDDADAERIFLPFYRSDPSRVRDGRSGAGLGLAVVRQIALEHHGDVTFSPTPGGGATFELQLPIAPAEVPPHGVTS